MKLNAASIHRHLDTDIKYKNYTFNKMTIEEKKEKGKLTISMDRGVLKKLEDNCTNKSVYIEYAVLDYMKRNGINIDDIIL
jgi:hypothetical protein